jgi:hypothetical protein
MVAGNLWTSNSHLVNVRSLSDFQFYEGYVVLSLHFFRPSSISIFYWRNNRFLTLLDHIAHLKFSFIKHDLFFTKTRTFYAWYQVLTAVILKSTVFRDVTPCNLAFFSGSKSEKIKQEARNKQREILLGWLIFLPWRWRQYVPQKLQSTSASLYCLTSQNIVCHVIRWIWTRFGLVIGFIWTLIQLVTTVL